MHVKQTLQIQNIHLSEKNTFTTQRERDKFDRYIGHSVFSTTRSKSVPSTLHFTEHWQSWTVLKNTSLARAALGTSRKRMSKPTPLQKGTKHYKTNLNTIKNSLCHQANLRILSSTSKDPWGRFQNPSRVSRMVLPGGGPWGST